MDPRSTNDGPVRDRAALRIAAIYLVIGGLWILLSDKAVSAIIRDPDMMTALSIYKGWFYVLTTALLLYSLIKHSVEKIHASEALIRQFHRSTISAVTDGKLNLVDYADIEQMLGKETADCELLSTEGLADMRARLRQLALSNGMSEDRACEFVTAAGEAAVNAVKHCGGGRARLAVKDDRVQVCVRDYGSGIDTLLLPHATLRTRYSNAASMGLGYSLILASTDRVWLATGGKGTCVLMERSTEPHAEQTSLDSLPDTW